MFGLRVFGLQKRLYSIQIEQQQTKQLQTNLYREVFYHMCRREIYACMDFGL